MSSNQKRNKKLNENLIVIAGAGKTKLKLFRMRRPAFFSDTNFFAQTAS